MNRSLQTTQQQYLQLSEHLNSLLQTFRFSAHINLKLQRIEQLLALLNHPERDMTLVHVGGTSGKGSTSTLLARCFSQYGLTSGLFTSPHLQLINETCQINNHPVNTDTLLEAWETIQPAVAQVGRDNPFGKPSYFEVLLAMALLVFQKHKVDVAVMEVGLGGRLDATNVLPAKVAVLVSIGLDHIEILGDSEEKIATEKAAIIKPGQQVICGFKQPVTRRVARKFAQKTGADLYLIDRDFYFQKHHDRLFSLISPFLNLDDLPLPMAGDFQYHNSACALTAFAATLHQRGDSLPDQAVIDRSLQPMSFPGRFEVLQARGKTVILDGAHNPDKLRSLFANIEQQYPNRPHTLVFGLKKDRAINNSLYSLNTFCQPQRVICSAFSNHPLWLSIPADELANALHRNNPGLVIDHCDKPLEALQTALRESPDNGLIVVTGSLYLLGEVREYWYPQDQLLAEIDDYWQTREQDQSP